MSPMIINNIQIPKAAFKGRDFEIEIAENIINIMQAGKGCSQTALKT